MKFAKEADMLIAASYWKPGSPVLFTREDIFDSGFQIRVIADITCDIEGSIPSTLKASTIEEPVYDYNPSEHRMANPYTDEANLSVMAVDNLPCELPRDASEDFGEQLISNIIPALLENGNDVIKGATIADNGSLTEKYNYLQEWVSE